MRDYIILNDKRSTLIRGLMICKLPPVTKPAMRTTTTTIDGRDGDIVTPLGYQSYDKVVEIGLHGNFDVDEVISYFNSSGTVTFSNEITKYYRYRIDNQIDFEKLIRFRTAKVTFHVQPFKFSTVEGAREITPDRPIFTFPKYEGAINGITVEPGEGNASFKLSGTATINTEIFVPIQAVTLQPGAYELNADVTGEAVDNGVLRLIRNAPADATSFGDEDKEVPLLGGQTNTITDTLTAAYTYNYIWLYIGAGTAVDTTITPSIKLEDSGTPPGDVIVRSVTNSGNTKARPKIRLDVSAGTMTIDVKVRTLYRGTTTMFTVNTEGITNYIEIDTEAQDATEGATLKNRYVTSDYSEAYLDPGSNVITVSITAGLGSVTKLTIENYSRWI